MRTRIDKENAPKLQALWERVFGDKAEAIAMFLNGCKALADVYVYEQGGEIASALYVLPASMVLAGAQTRAGYIYAAATLPRARGQGIMSRLLKEAAAGAAEDGLSFLTLRPANSPLFDYYAKHGYDTIYKAAPRVFSKEALEAVTVPGGKEAKATPAFVSGALKDAFADRPGSLLWEADMLIYQLAIHAYYGGKAVAADTPAGKTAVLYFEEKDRITCLDPIASRESFPYLCEALGRETGGKPIWMRLPVGLVGKETRTDLEPVGMACPVTGSLSQMKDAFLPLTME